jgi:hypothetical protein
MSQQSEMVLISRTELEAILDRKLAYYFKSATAKPETPEEDITDVAGLAALSKLAPQTIYTKVHKKEFPEGIVFKRGKRLYFSKRAFRAWVQDGAI